MIFSFTRGHVQFVNPSVNLTLRELNFSSSRMLNGLNTQAASKYSGLRALKGK